MSHTVLAADILLISSFGYLFLLWKTNSMKVSISTTAIVCMVVATGTLHKLGLLFCGFLFMIIAMGILVWRVIPHDKADTWSKDV